MNATSVLSVAATGQVVSFVSPYVMMSRPVTLPAMFRPICPLTKMTKTPSWMTHMALKALVGVHVGMNIVTDTIVVVVIITITTTIGVIFLTGFIHALPF
jgi:hypothetical protein